MKSRTKSSVSSRPAALLLPLVVGLSCWLAPARSETNGPTKPERFISYTNAVDPEVPWSVHIVKADYSHPELRFYTALGGGEVMGMETVTDQLKTLPPGVGQPLAAINGDFYDKSKDFPIRPRDLQIRNGELLTQPSGHSSFWIDAQGRPQMTNIHSRFRVVWPDGKTSPIGFNVPRAEDAIVLYTAAVGKSTFTQRGADYVLEPVNPESWLPLRPGLTYEAKVRSVQNTGNQTLDRETMVLSVGPDVTSSVPALRPGATLRIILETVPGPDGGDGGDWRRPRAGERQQGHGMERLGACAAPAQRARLEQEIPLSGAGGRAAVGCFGGHDLRRAGGVHAQAGLRTRAESRRGWFIHSLVIRQRAQQSQRRSGTPLTQRLRHPQKKSAAGGKVNPGRANLYCASLLLVTLSSAVAGRAGAPGTDLFTNGVIPRLRLELSADAMASLKRDPREYVAASLSEGALVYRGAGLHLKGSGGSFRTLADKPSFTIDFTRFENGHKFHGLRKIHLNNSVEDPSFVNEIIGGEMFRAAGVPAPRVTRALVELNGRALGLYVLKEGFTEDFLAGHFQRVSGELYEPESGQDVDQKLKRNSVLAPAGSRTALRALATAAVEPDAARRWQQLQAALDIDQFVKFMAMEILLGHRDGYCLAKNNFRVYHDLDSGKMVFFPQGMDQMLGTAEFPWRPSLAGLVARSVMSTPEGEARYVATFGSLLTNVFKVEELTNRVDQLVEELRPVLSGGDWARIRQEASFVTERIVQRQRSLLAQFNQPARVPLQFRDRVAPLDGWTVTEGPSHVKLDQVTTPEGEALHIATAGETAASWRTQRIGSARTLSFRGASTGLPALPPSPMVSIMALDCVWAAALDTGTLSSVMRRGECWRRSFESNNRPRRSSSFASCAPGRERPGSI